MNPYLVITAILGGMLHGLETGAKVPLPLDDPNAVPADSLSDDWRQTVDRFGESTIVRTLFDDRHVDIYTAIRHDELSKLTRKINQVEYRAYLGRLYPITRRIGDTICVFRCGAS